MIFATARESLVVLGLLGPGQFNMRIKSQIKSLLPVSATELFFITMAQVARIIRKPSCDF